MDDALTPTSSAAQLERTHPMRHDLAWLPPSFKALKWTIAGSIWTALAGGAVATFALAKFNAYFFGKAIFGVGAAGYYAGDRAARFAIRSRLGRLARGEAELGRLRNSDDGELLHVRGKVRARATVESLLGDRPAVFRRLIVESDSTRVVHETACDFLVFDPRGESVQIEVESAHLVVPDPKSETLPGDADTLERVLALPLHAEFDGVRALRAKRIAKGKKPGELKVTELCIHDGDEVEIVGYKSRVVDPTMADRMARETPMRATLRGGKALPVLIALAKGEAD